MTGPQDDSIKALESLFLLFAVPGASGYPNKIRDKSHPWAIPEIDRKADTGFLKPVSLARNRAYDGERSVANIFKDWRGE